MGNITSVFSYFFAQKKEARILMLGLDAAGKTTILYQFKEKECIRTIPTIGFNVETIQMNKINLTVWDIGGQNKIRSLWEHYYEGSTAVIWVLDASDNERFDEACFELHKVMLHRALRGAVLLVLANKSDLVQGSESLDEKVRNNLDLDKLGLRKCMVQPCSATTGVGLDCGMKWLCENL